MDFDEALVTLWDAGIESPESPDDRILQSEVGTARRALGLESIRELRSVDYWQGRLGLTRDELTSELDRLGLAIAPKARVLPKGALRRLRRSELADASSGNVQMAAMAVSTEPSSDQAELLWRTVGRTRKNDTLSVEELIHIHKALEEEFATTSDPIEPSGIRDRNLLESAVFRVQTSLGEESKYPTAEMTASALMHSVVNNHPFFNGNKRTAVVSLLVALDRNNVLLTCSEAQLFRLVLRAAQHRLVPRHWNQLADREVIEIATWVCENSRPLARGDRLIRWRELRSVLTSLGCTLEGPIPGNRMRVRRTVERKGLFGRRRKQDLVGTFWYGSDGKQLDPTFVKDVRRVLELDDDHGYDSEHFYGKDPREPDEFIAEHRNLLRRLAKL